jgi:hypothetical protein
MVIVGIILLGIFTFAIVNVISNFQTGNELDYYLLEETTEAAMIDAVDISYYRVSGTIRMDREKFLESFVRRFAASVTAERDYKIKVIDVNETPPKVSIQVGSGTVASFAGDNFDIINKVDAIIETKYNEDRQLGEVE